MKMLVSYYGLCSTFSGISIAPFGEGEILATYPAERLLDIFSNSYCNIWNADDQPIRLQYSGLTTLPTTSLANGDSAWYIEASRNVFDISDGVNYYSISTSSSATVTGLVLDITILGDDSGNAPNDYQCYLSGLVNAPRAHSKTILYREGLDGDTGQYKWLSLGNIGYADAGEEEKIYSVLYGILIDLPDGKTFVDTRNDSYPGSSVIIKPFGNWVGNSIGNEGKKRSVDIIMNNLSPTQRDMMFDIFKYSRGVYPLMLVEDSTDTDTWFIGVSRSLKQSEPMSDSYNLVMSLEEL